MPGASFDENRLDTLLDATDGVGTTYAPIRMTRELRGLASPALPT